MLTLRPTAGRVAAVLSRNLVLVRRNRALMLLSGVLEPVFYLLSIGVGVGSLVGDLPLADGRRVPYAAYVAPAMLAAAAMNGAITETLYVFFGRLRYARLYEAILATPVRPVEIALGELGWALVRGTVYSALFLALMVGLDLASWPRALAALPVTLLVGVVFGAAGMLVATLLRSWQDFDLTITAQYVLLLFSATFIPPERLPGAARWLVELSPLAHAVALLRGLLVGGAGAGRLALSAALLAALAAACFAVAARRLARRLHR
ncbi:hypothetical protein GCM10010123_02460 [Pilimelia anulata]|uniref:Transport permease protein n=1 Tax=Pilimelia anulata TaxID=53371 RepID=A0A8J3F5Z1_9ACTN|nr:ABC transporter permease [Pilimelia anulata]GGJ75996.1 hypothetical protein GCM10010123_02460 [Pilimelia anulata]